MTTEDETEELVQEQIEERCQELLAVRMQDHDLVQAAIYDYMFNDLDNPAADLARFFVSVEAGMMEYEIASAAVRIWKELRNQVIPRLEGDARFDAEFAVRAMIELSRRDEAEARGMRRESES